MGKAKRLLIANRGEIACRIIRSAQREGFETWALYSDADARAQHVQLADHALSIGPAPARDSYLSIEKVIAAATTAKADLIHPGYGFLSENAAFARACEAAGFVFVGPPSSAIEQMGDKAAAKNLLTTAGVPMVPGYQGEAQDDATLIEAGQAIGFPLLIKPSAGGGGKGMHIVRTAAELPAALAQSRREAQSAFGDPHLLLERYLEGARHIEIQIFFDQQGQGVYLFERDCSVQRRHQKVLEEAPAPGIGAELRQRMGEAALAAGRAVGYRSAGTVEFLLDQTGEFFFMEMNTRLQVEHPVTELITGTDLVAWQLAIAQGAPLPKQQDELSISGHAIEARLYAEDPERDFLPASGTLKRLDWPKPAPWLRIDTGVVTGDLIGIDYDPMLAKLIVQGPDRTSALVRLEQALEQTRILGLATNRDYLLRLTRLPPYRAGRFDTGLIEHQADQLAAEAVDSHQLLLLATLAELAASANDTARAESPWQRQDSWRLDGPGRRWLSWQVGDDPARELCIEQNGTEIELELDDQHAQGQATLNGETALVLLEGVQHRIGWVAEGDLRWLHLAGRWHTLRLINPDRIDYRQSERAPSLKAPMPGVIVQRLVAEGQPVAAGTPLLLLEAMKMEHSLNAPSAGAVSAFYFAEGDQVEQGAELLAFNASENKS